MGSVILHPYRSTRRNRCKILFGNIQKDVLGSGLHFINPLLEIKKIDIKTQNYTMSGVNDEGDKSGDDAIRVLTSDGLEVTIDLTVPV